MSRRLRRRVNASQRGPAMGAMKEGGDEILVLVSPGFRVLPVRKPEKMGRRGHGGTLDA
ncbi:MAG: hypothetical protein MUF23_08025 [Pirellula sp.]|jgi:hypothetical protein|nr:hypothetical protein [Pirellula sp.]